MGIGDKTIMSVGSDIAEVTFELVESMISEDSELVSLYFGEEVTEEAAQEIADRISAKYDSVDVEVHSGGQPIYYYVVSIE